MSKYTTEVRYICEHYAELEESAGFDDIDDIIDEAQSHIFKEYPIFDEEYRAVLNHKILAHYYTREICSETVGLWKLWLNNKMNEIMPYYNQLYKSALLEFNPFDDIDLTTSKIRNEDKDSQTDSSSLDNGKEKTSYGESGNGTSATTDKTKSTDSASSSMKDTYVDATTDKNVDKFSDTPQGNLTGIEQGNYLTNATISDKNTIENTEAESSASSSSNSQTDRDNITSNSTETEGNTERNLENASVSSSNNKVKTTEDYIEKISGKRSAFSYSDLLTKYRKTFLNIDLMIIGELDNLFLKLW